MNLLLQSLSDLKPVWHEAGYWKIGSDLYITDKDSIVIAIIDSAIDETLVVYWDQEEHTWFHYTNCFGLGEGNSESTRSLIYDWIEKHTF